MRHKIGSKLGIPSVVRLYATHGRAGESLEKCSKYKLARKMQKTHDFASSSTPLCKQRSRGYKSQEIQEMQCGIRDAANSRCCLHQYAPPQRSNAYLCWPQILQKRYKLNWKAEDSMRRKIGNNAILQEILKMQISSILPKTSPGSQLVGSLAFFAAILG